MGLTPIATLFLGAVVALARITSTVPGLGMLKRTVITAAALFVALCATPRAAADPTASGKALAPAQSTVPVRTAPLQGAEAALRRLSNGAARGEARSATS